MIIFIHAIVIIWIVKNRSPLVSTLNLYNSLSLFLYWFDPFLLIFEPWLTLHSISIQLLSFNMQFLQSKLLLLLINSFVGQWIAGTTFHFTFNRKNLRSILDTSLAILLRRAKVFWTCVFEIQLMILQNIVIQIQKLQINERNKLHHLSINKKVKLSECNFETS